MDMPLRLDNSRPIAVQAAHNFDWTLAKYTFVVACILRCLVAALTTKNLDGFLVDAVMAPVFAIAFTALAVLTKGVVLGWGPDSPLPAMRSLLWLFVTGLALGGLAGGALAGTAKDTAVAAVVVAALVAGFLGAFSFLLVGMWTIMIIAAVRDLRHKIVKASQIERRENPPVVPK